MLLSSGLPSLLASLFLLRMKCCPNLSAFPVNSRSSGFMSLCCVMYVCSLVVSASDIFIGGLAKQPFVFTAVMVLWSACMCLTCKPFSPCISIGLSPVSALTCILMDSSFPIPDIRVVTCSSVGGCIPVSSGV